MSLLNLDTIRCEALFASTLEQADDLPPDQVRQAVMRSVRSLGSRGCAAWVAQEFGDYPEVAAGRMRWARRLVAEVYGYRRPAGPKCRSVRAGVAELGTQPVGTLDDAS
jgi:hypothetical protein